MTAYELRSYPGGAADTTLGSDVTASGLTFAVQPGTGSGYPDGSAGPFYVVIDYDNTSTEKVHCTARSGDTFTADARGADGTTAFPHTSGAKVRACFTATDAQEANRAAHYTVGQVTTKGDLLGATGSAALGRIPKTADGTVLTADSTAATGWSGKSLPTLLEDVTLDGLTLTTATLTGPTLTIPAVTGATETGSVLDATSSIGGVTGTQIAALEAAHATPLAGVLGSNKSTNGTLFTIGSLAIGTWLITVPFTLFNTVNSAGTVTATGATGITLSGVTSQIANASANAPVGNGVLSFVAVVTTAGLVTVTLSALGGTGAAIEAGNTGYTALKVA